MPPRNWKLRVTDILQAIARIERYVENVSFAKFSGDEMRIDAVIRNLGIIGEAARHVPSEVQEKYPNIPWADMRGIRNVITHEYFGIALAVIWETVRDDLPPLVAKLQSLLDEEEENKSDGRA